MSSSSHNNKSNWHRYFNLLQAKDIPDNKHRYYMSHVQAFLKAFPNRSISSLQKGEIEAYTNTLTTARHQALDAIKLSAPPAEIVR